jgi:catechol 2,3-dioxygenase-like lactoylglutathione lyase family enzyme
MFDHVTIRASDRDASERFYDAVLATLGLDKTRESEHFAAWGGLLACVGERRETGDASAARGVRRAVT